MAKRRKRKSRFRNVQNFSSLLEKAAAFMHKGNLSAAQKSVSEAAMLTDSLSDRQRVNYTQTELHFRLLVKEANPNRKLELVDAALRTAPEDARLHFQRGIALLQTGKAADALHAFDFVAQTEPEREGLVFFRQLALLGQKKAPEKRVLLSEEEKNTIRILEDFQKKPLKKVVATLPEGPFLGKEPQLWPTLLTMCHDKQSAPLSFFEQAEFGPLRQRVSSTISYYHGLAAMRSKQPEAAEKLWTIALEHGFSPRWCQKNVGLSVRQKFVNFAEKGQWKALVSAVDRLPSDLKDETLNQLQSLALFHLGYEQAEKKRWAQAEQFWLKAAYKTNNRYLAQNTALVLEQLEDWEGAATCWKNMLRRRPQKIDHPDYLTDKQVSAVWNHISDCYHHDYLDEDAIDCLIKAIQYDRQNTALRFKYISALETTGIGGPERIIRELNDILKHEPDNVQALTQLAHYYNNDWYHDALPIWKKILELEPHNKEAQTEVAMNYVNRALPGPGSVFMPRKRPTYKKQLAILQEGLDLLPDQPDILLAFGFVHIDARKKKLAKEAFMKAFRTAPHDLHISSSVLQNLIHLQEKSLIETMIPEIQSTPNLLPGFWIEQSREAVDHPGWPERFLEAALEQVNHTPHASQVSTLVDIYMTLPAEEPRLAHLKRAYLAKIEREFPKSGAIECIQAFTTFIDTGNQGKAKRLVHKAKKLATVAADTPLLRQIERVEQTMVKPPSLVDMMLGGQGMPDLGPIPPEIEGILSELERTHGKKGLEKILEQMMFEFGGLDDGEFF